MIHRALLHLAVPSGSGKTTLIEWAQVVVVNLRPDDESQRAQDLRAETPRLRKDRDVFDDVIGLLGNRAPITAVVASLRERADLGLRKCFARGRRTLRSVSV